MSAALLIRAVIGAGAACEAVGTFAQQLIEHEGSWAVKKAQVSGGTTVTIVDNFLPPELAANWYTSLNATWASSAPCREDVSKCVATEEDGNDVCSWLYTTNSRGGNGKIRSVFQREERRRAVQSQYQRGAFAYSKWELTAGHTLYTAMGEMMSTKEVRSALARTTGLAPATSTTADTALGDITDYFVTAYDHGDFLSTHSDGASGSLAWVLHLSDGVWEAASGGALRFNRGRTHAQIDFAPSYNRLLLFLTRPDYVPHQVLLTKPAGHEPRFGMTGWYLTRGDHFSAATQRENDAMKAAASKATSHSQCL